MKGNDLFEELLQEFYFSDLGKKGMVLRRKIVTVEKVFIKMLNNQQKDVYFNLKALQRQNGLQEKENLILFCQKFFK